MRFDYLHSPRPLLFARIADTRIPVRLQSAVAALAGALAVVAGAWSIDAYRLHAALQIEAVYQQRYDDTSRALRQANLYYKRVRRLVELDRRIRQIAASGEADAQSLAEIANDLPAHAWLTGITHDGSGLALQGRAKDLSVVSGVIKGFVAAKRLHNPTLVSARLDDTLRRDSTMSYEIHVDGGK